MLPSGSASIALSTTFAIRPHIAFFISVSFRVLSCALAIAFCTFALAAFYRVSVPSTCWVVLIAVSVLVLLGCAIVCDSASSFGSLTAFLADQSMGFARFSGCLSAFFFRPWARVQVGASESLSTKSRLEEISISTSYGSRGGGCGFGGLGASKAVDTAPGVFWLRPTGISFRQASDTSQRVT